MILLPKFNDPIITGLATKYGLIKVTKSKKVFLDIVESILSQQLSVKASNTIIIRVKKVLDKLSPEKILSTEDLVLRACGISWAKIKYIKDLSTRTLDERFN